MTTSADGDIVFVLGQMGFWGIAFALLWYLWSVTPVIDYYLLAVVTASLRQREQQAGQ